MDFRKLISIMESSDQVAQLIADCSDAGCDVELDVEGDTLSLIFISRMTNLPKGTGRDAMKLICAFADRERLFIHLDAMGGDPRLISYYESFGFEMDPTTRAKIEAGEEGEDWDDMCFMFREPK